VPGSKLPSRIQAGRGVFTGASPGIARLPFAAVTTPITAGLIARSHRVGDPRWSPSGNRLAWTDSFDGRNDLVVAASDGSAPPTVVTAECALGAGWCWAGDDELVIVAGDGRLLAIASDGTPRRVLHREGDAIGPTVSARGEVAFAIERDDSCDVATVPLDGSAWPVRVTHVDYAWDPAWSPDGSMLAWHEWDLPAMPWDASRVMVRTADGSVRVVAGGDAVAASQPRFSPDGSRIAFISDADGWPVLWVADIAGTSEGSANARPVISERKEHAEPAWGHGQRSYAWSPDGTELAWCRNEDGFGRLVIAAPGSRSARELSRGWHRSLDWNSEGIACVRSGAVTPPQVVVLAANGSGRRLVARGAAGGFEATGLVEPKAVKWKAGSATVNGLLWRGSGAAGSRPLLVMVHGGPTGQSLADWTPQVQAFVQRGWSVLQPDYRGSSGHGRAYTQALAGRWGERDVADVAAGIRHAVKEGWGDAARVAVVGGSAGGMTALLVAAQYPDLVQAVVARYPVCDLVDLALTTHRFESTYHLRLVGPLPAAADVYRDRSPVSHAADIRVPVLLLHGDKDTSVPVVQSESIADALRAAGTPVERHVYAGEGHGWRRAETIADDFDRVHAFLTRWVLPR
jgi:dipeptidyl aminopeptidase/acylaminoacyl peptidase